MKWTNVCNKNENNEFIPNEVKYREFIKNLSLEERSVVYREKQKSLKDIITGFAHEINNPLTGIIGNLELIELKDNLSFETKKQLNTIKNLSLRIKDVISNMALFDSESYDTKHSVDIINLLQKLIKISKKEYAAHQLTISFNNTLTSAIVIGNPFVLWQIFFNIFQNSVESIQENKDFNSMFAGCIDIDQKISANQKMLIIQIRDNGPGFTNIDRAVDPFYSTKDRTIHKGIGLSIAFNSIQELGGEIIIKNTKIGALVSVHIPLNSYTE
jgi:two-component system NtrC family sensor kinase